MVYTGNSSYCYSNSLHMCLSIVGKKDVPDVSYIECLTGMPFGTCFLDVEMPMFFPSPVQTEPHEGLTQALKTLGWSCELWQSDSAEEAEVELTEVLKYGPVLLGPIDMGLLSYDPNHKFKQGADHFVVVLGIEEEFALIHDPQFYPYATLPIKQLIKAWSAEQIGYIDKAYTLRHSFIEQQTTTRALMNEATLILAEKIQSDDVDHPVFFGGSSAFEKAIDLLEGTPNPSFSGLLTNFALPIGARRSVDAMQFMKEVEKPKLSSLYNTKAKLFGKAQYYAVMENWSEVNKCFNRLSETEEALVQQIKG